MRAAATGARVGAASATSAGTDMGSTPSASNGTGVASPSANYHVRWWRRRGPAAISGNSTGIADWRAICASRGKWRWRRPGVHVIVARPISENACHR